MLPFTRRRARCPATGGRHATATARSSATAGSTPPGAATPRSCSPSTRPRRSEGVGSFILGAPRGGGRVARASTTSTTRSAEHPQRDLVHDWLVVRGFRGPVDGDLRKRVGSTPARRRTRGAAYDLRDPGHAGLRSGGYVNVEDHRTDPVRIEPTQVRRATYDVAQEHTGGHADGADVSHRLRRPQGLRPGPRPRTRRTPHVPLREPGGASARAGRGTRRRRAAPASRGRAARAGRSGSRNGNRRHSWTSWTCATNASAASSARRESRSVEERRGSGPRRPSRSHASASSRRSSPMPPTGPDPGERTARRARGRRRPRTSSALVASGVTQSPGVGEPRPSQVSRVRSRCRSCRWVSGIDTVSTSHRPSHGCGSRMKP